MFLCCSQSTCPCQIPELCCLEEDFKQPSPQLIQNTLGWKSNTARIRSHFRGVIVRTMQHSWHRLQLNDRHVLTTASILPLPGPPAALPFPLHLLSCCPGHFISPAQMYSTKNAYFFFCIVLSLPVKFSWGLMFRRVKRWWEKGITQASCVYSDCSFKQRQGKQSGCKR